MIGIDEVGRGAWAGPLVVAGCLFTENPGFIRELNDSKKLSKNVREKVAEHVKSSTLFEIVIVPSDEVDKLGLTLAIKQAILQILEKLPKNEEIMLDGKYNFLKGTKYESLTNIEVKADATYVSVMAASVIAKVERDRIMVEYDLEYPEYGFKTNVGYGTARHIAALQQFGSTEIHRKSVKPIHNLT